MAKQWMEIKNEIEDEIDRIWFKVPEEIEMAMKGCFPSGANVDGSAFGDMYWLTTDTNKIGRHAVEPAMYRLLSDDQVSLEELKHFWKYLTGGTATVLGGVSQPICPAPWLNLGGVCRFYHEIADAMDSIKTKDEFREILYSWFNYLTCLNYWARVKFPWEILWYNSSIYHKV